MFNCFFCGRWPAPGEYVTFVPSGSLVRWEPVQVYLPPLWDKTSQEWPVPPALWRSLKILSDFLSILRLSTLSSLVGSWCRYCVPVSPNDFPTVCSLIAELSLPGLIRIRPLPSVGTSVFSSGGQLLPGPTIALELLATSAPYSQSWTSYRSSSAAIICTARYSLGTCWCSARPMLLDLPPPSTHRPSSLLDRLPILQ